MRVKRLLLGLLALLALLYLTRYQWLPPIAAWLNRSAPQLPVDYVIPLPGGNDDRPFAAAALVKAGHAQRVGILVNELTPDVANGVALPMHQVTERVLRLRGVAAESILTLPGTSNSTYSDVQIIGQLLARKPNATIALVTSTSHTRRVRWSVDHILPRYRDQICVIGTINDHYDESRWWQSDLGLKATLGEYAKLVFYWLHYSSSRQRAVVFAIILAIVIAWIQLTRGRRVSGSTPSTEAAAQG
jgi:uncharacterized SAM-binding protein YcdF (DUF218 family)